MPKAISIRSTGGETLLPKHLNLSCRAAGQETLVRNPISGTVHFLNPAAIVVWECCDGATSLDICVLRLKERFNISGCVDLVADIQETIVDFREKGLLESFHAGL